jgi:hypothetical protein
MLRIQLNQPKPTFEQCLGRTRTASKSEPKLCRRVRSANSYAARLGNSKPLCTSVSGYRLPDSSHRGRGASCPRRFNRCQTAEFAARRS